MIIIIYNLAIEAIYFVLEDLDSDFLAWHGMHFNFQNFFFGNSKKLIINLWLTRLGTRVVVVHTFHAQSSYPQVKNFDRLSYLQATSQASKQQQKKSFFPP